MRERKRRDGGKRGERERKRREITEGRPGERGCKKRIKKSSRESHRDVREIDRKNIFRCNSIINIAKKSKSNI